MIRRGPRIRMDKALEPVPEFRSEEKAVALKHELALLGPYVGKPSALRDRVAELRRRLHELTGLPLYDERVSPTPKA